jgi:hypothetical protein
MTTTAEEVLEEALQLSAIAGVPGLTWGETRTRIEARVSRTRK